MAVFITFFGYVFVVYLISWFASTNINKVSDFVLADRKLSAPVTALGAGAADMSGWLMMALPGALFIYGCNQLWLPVGLVLGAFLNWQFVAQRLRIYTKLAGDSLTIPSYFEHRFSHTGQSLRIVTALVIVFFFSFYISAGFVAGGLLMKSVFGISYVSGVLYGVCFILFYTLIGGFLAINWVDFFQGILMLFSLLIVPIVAIYNFDGNIWLDFVNSDMVRLDVLTGISWIHIVSLLGWGLGYFGQPHILSRFMAIQDAKEMPMARFIGMSWMVLSLYGAIIIGLVGWIFYAGDLAKPDTIFLVLAQDLFNPFLAGILLAAVFSAIMSTATAQLLASASAIVEDLYHPFAGKQITQNKLIWMTRFFVILVSIISVILALNSEQTILQMVGYAWSGLGATFGPAILISLYWQDMTYKGCIYGMISGAVTVVAWYWLGDQYSYELFEMYAIIPGFLVNSGLILWISLFDVAPTKTVMNTFLTMKQQSGSK